ncbi:MAG: ABC transporter ATP-binding protein [Burkholderiales bacterium]
MLEVRGLQTSYGRSQVLFGVDLEIRKAEVISVLGRNGMGKTTTVRSVMGITRPKSGTISFEGKEIHGLPSYRIAQAGLGLVPEGRQVFPNLTVRENLVATAANRRSNPKPWTLERIFALFPQLQERHRHFGNQLSGGEQQMLAIGRALMTNPRLLILDEATEGLAPLIVAEIWRVVSEIRATGISTLIVDRNYRAVLAHTDRAVVLEKGRVVADGSSAELAQDLGALARWLGV